MNATLMNGIFATIKAGRSAEGDTINNINNSYDDDNNKNNNNSKCLVRKRKYVLF